MAGDHDPDLPSAGLIGTWMFRRYHSLHGVLGLKTDQPAIYPDRRVLHYQRDISVCTGTSLGPQPVPSAVALMGVGRRLDVPFGRRRRVPWVSGAYPFGDKNLFRCPDSTNFRPPSSRDTDPLQPYPAPDVHKHCRSFVLAAGGVSDCRAHQRPSAA